MDDWTLDLCRSAGLTELHPWAHGYKKLLEKLSISYSLLFSVQYGYPVLESLLNGCI